MLSWSYVCVCVCMPYFFTCIAVFRWAGKNGWRKMGVKLQCGTWTHSEFLKFCTVNLHQVETLRGKNNKWATCFTTTLELQSASIWLILKKKNPPYYIKIVCVLSLLDMLWQPRPKSPLHHCKWATHFLDTSLTSCFCTTRTWEASSSPSLASDRVSTLRYRLPSPRDSMAPAE